MAQTDDSISLNPESHLKRKAISECRLQDPKIWTKISWIRTNFIKDLESGVRKTDFYNFVTEHLGKTGYRDVWHLLKIAYPHVDRVRRGRKYMYWGIRHADGHVEFDDTDEANAGLDDEEANSPTDTSIESPIDVNQDKEYSTEDNASKMEGSPESESQSAEYNFEGEISSKSGIPSNGSSDEVESLYAKSTSLHDDGSPSIVSIKLEKDPDLENQELDDVVVMEFRDKEVFASFEDYEKSKQTDQNGNFAETLDKKPRVNKKTNGEQTRSISRSVSPPLEIFSFLDTKTAEKIEDPSIALNDHHGNDVLDSDHENDKQSTSLKQQDRFHGDNSNGAPEKQKNDALTVGKSTSLGQDQRKEFVPNLLEPENINRMCMPLIKDLAKKVPNKGKTRSPNHEQKVSSVNGQLGNSQLNNIQDSGNLTMTPSVDDSKADGVRIEQKFSCAPMIVSVASMAGIHHDKHSGKPCFNEISDILKAAQLHSGNDNMNKKTKDVSLKIHPPTAKPQSVVESEAEYVVVQDRATQVTEHIHTCNLLGKRGSKQIKSTKPHFSKTEYTLKKTSSSNTNTSNPDDNSALNKAGKQENRVHTRSQSHAWSTGDSPLVSGLPSQTASAQSEIHDGTSQQRIPVGIPGNSHSSSKPNVRGNIVRSEEPLMSALVNKPPSYHSLALRNRNSADGNNFTEPQVVPRRLLLPKPISTTSVINTASTYQVRSSSKINSPDMVYNTTSSAFPTGYLSVNNERNKAEKYSVDDSALRNREFIRKILGNDEGKSSSGSYASTSDLQVTIDCLSSELEKERTMRLRLEIELRKVENQLKEERAINERLATLLMKR